MQLAHQISRERDQTRRGMVRGMSSGKHEHHHEKEQKESHRWMHHNKRDVLVPTGFLLHLAHQYDYEMRENGHGRLMAGHQAIDQVLRRDNLLGRVRVKLINFGRHDISAKQLAGHLRHWMDSGGLKELDQIVADEKAAEAISRKAHRKQTA